MRVIAEFSLIPIGGGVSLSRYIAACQKVLQGAPLTVELHANGTNLEGEWEAVMAAIKTCHEVVHAMGVPRISTSLKIGTRSDRPPHLKDALESVRRRLKEGSA